MKRDNKLYIVAGLPGSGKTTVAREIADRAAARHIRSDAIRLELFEDPTYASHEKEVVYATMLRRARQRLEHQPVVVDATFNEKSYRQGFAVYDNSVLIKVVADDETVEKRMEERDDISEADFGVRELKRKQWEPIKLDYHVVDNSGSLRETKARIGRLLFPNA